MEKRVDILDEMAEEEEREQDGTKLSLVWKELLICYPMKTD
jgi:hypothetical protein